MIDNFTDTELKNEQWRDVDGYDGMYQVSDLGRVRSLKFGKVRVLRAKKDKNGYFSVMLSKNNNQKRHSVHRLVALTFIPNDDESKTIINHINECKSDDRASNLEWCDRSYNQTYNDINWRRKNGIRRKIAKLYNQDLTYEQNIELFKENGIDCSKRTVLLLRRDLELINHKTKRDKLKDLYRPDLTYKQNIALFKKQGIDCSIATFYRLRKDITK